MPKYLDHHKGVDLPPEVLKQAVQDIKTGKVNKYGIKALNGFAGKNGEAWCYLEAPSADVVHKYHEDMGLKLEKGQVVEVASFV